MIIKRTRAQTPRSRSGCLTCRSRHIKCDEALPVCGNCAKSNKVCERGAKLKFLKCMVFKPPSPIQSSVIQNSITKSYKFLDQSYSIHSLYKENQFHDYSNWLVEHSDIELAQSDSDIRDSLRKLSIISNKSNISIVHHQRNSTENPQNSESRLIDRMRSNNNESLIDDASDSDSIQNSIPAFPSISVTRLKNLSDLTSIDDSMFVYSEKPSSFNSFDATTKDEIISLVDFASAIDHLDNINTSQNDQNNTSLTFPIFLSALVTGVKLKKVDGLFRESYLSSKIASYVTESLKVEENQTYDNLMNFFELLLVDLNNSLITKKPMKIKIHDENIEFILKKILSWSLFDDLNYFLIEVIVILMKLNNLYYRPQAILKGIHLTAALQRLKALENNHFIRAYIPTRSFFPIDGHTETDEEQHMFQNLKLRRFHIYFNFTVVFIFRQLVLTDELKQLMLQATILANFWISYNHDPFERIRVLIKDDHQYDYSKDPFLNFIPIRIK